MNSPPSIHTAIEPIVPQDFLSRNLAALSASDPDLARRLTDSVPLAVDWGTSPDGLPVASVIHNDKPVQICSRFDPVAEAKKLIEPVDFTKHACVAVLGVGLGYHLAELVKARGQNVLILVYEPDTSLLRAVLEKTDQTAWLGQSGVVLFAGSTDRATLLGKVEPHSGVLTQGTILVTHPATRIRYTESVALFAKTMTEVLAYCRTHVATALVNALRTIENVTGNIARFVGGPNTNELFEAAKGYPAVCVSAGPSLAKNVHLLSDPAIRSKVVVIAVQTALKPLLDRGIRPDFVTALDYHEISRRFYEGLPALPDVTLVAEPKAHPSVIASFPGPVRTTGNNFLNKLLGDQAPSIREIKSGATVAHLSFYLAQHLGCDPIILIGQDLAFSDGLYYCPGTAIHEVWAPELSWFNTLEMMEWQRIVRHRALLHRQEDIEGRQVYSDEQMLTYLKQFERDFDQAMQQVIDATEGGLAKKQTHRMTLAGALERFALRDVPRWPMPQVGELDPVRLKAAMQKIRHRLEEVQEIRRLTKETIPLLKDFRRHQREYEKSSRIYEKIQKNKQMVDRMDEAFDLVSELNTVGTYNRTRADRAINNRVDQDDPFATQKLQLDRDMENLRWLLQSCDELLQVLRTTKSQIQTAMDQIQGRSGRG